MSRKKDKKSPIVERFKLIDLDDQPGDPEELQDPWSAEIEDEEDEDERQDVMSAPPMPKGRPIRIVTLDELAQQPSGQSFSELDDVFDSLNDKLQNQARRIPRRQPGEVGGKRPQPTTKTWTDRYGRQIKFVDMDDDYLVNVLRTLLNRAPGTVLQDKITVLSHTERCWEGLLEEATKRGLMDEVTWGFAK